MIGAVVAARAAYSSAKTARTGDLVIFLVGLALAIVVSSLTLVLGASRARALERVDEQAQELRRRAMHDELTGLPNRALDLGPRPSATRPGS